MKKTLFLTAILVLSMSFIHAGSFNSNLSSSEKKTVDSGKTLLKNTGKAKKMCITDETDLGKRVRSVMNKLDPSYMAEAIQKFPYKGYEDLPEVMEEIITDFDSYIGIPYWSEEHDRYFDLYSAAEKISDETKNGTRRIVADLKMSPFGVIKTDIIIEKTEDSFYYESTNLNQLRYKDKMDCVSPKHQKSVIIAFREGDSWIVYGAGAVDAPKIPFLSGRVETSFINRIKTFCKFCIDRV
ncbi:hypothetical protein DYE49_05570 [Treponema rectale]|uniref:Uncharacterized protein n=1 Tax=Treponema rectale TaxID=744512 RepID=A0A840SFY7_9SPIR|nr:DUF6675 family protein [Treponema rectale]MBB5218352.1 hypothetical protein [Treponema rectale]QOS39951.1 hypothetical protein DYE49_05570 [Treponema rectale]